MNTLCLLSILLEFHLSDILLYQAFTVCARKVRSYDRTFEKDFISFCLIAAPWEIYFLRIGKYTSVSQSSTDRVSNCVLI